MLQLPNVTLFAISAANFALTQRAIEICQEQCKFGDALFMSNFAHRNNAYRTEIIPSFQNSSETANFAFTGIAKYINTPFLLCVQWDGYIVNADAWTEEFFEYDYIGAKWPWHVSGQNVGNGGFCLRSRRLIRLLEDLVESGEIALPDQIPEDEYVCQHLRPKLENLGMKFAPEEVADHFSYERSAPSQNTFGFHGLFNMWRHVDYSELESVVSMMDDYVINGDHYRELERAYVALGKFELAEIMANRRAALLLAQSTSPGRRARTA